MAERKTGKGGRLFKILLPLLLAAALLIGVLSVTGVFASLIDTTARVRNELKTAVVTCQVNDDRTITNTGNIPAVIRAKIIVNFVDANGNVLAAAPDAAEYLTAGAGWTHLGGTGLDAGYWYYNGIVAPGTATEALFTVRESGARIQILAEALQAAPADAAAEAWGVAFDGTAWSVQP